MMTSYTSSAINDAGFLVLGCTCLWSFSTTSLKTLSVDLWRFDTLILAANREKSGCCVAM